MGKKGLLGKIIMLVIIVLIIIGGFVYYKMRTGGFSFNTGDAVINIDYTENVKEGEIGVVEVAVQTTAAIDNLLGDRQERFNKVLERIESENEKMKGQIKEAIDSVHNGHEDDMGYNVLCSLGEAC